MFEIKQSDNQSFKISCKIKVDTDIKISLLLLMKRHPRAPKVTEFFSIFRCMQKYLHMAV